MIIKRIITGGNLWYLIFDRMRWKSRCYDETANYDHDYDHDYYDLSAFGMIQSFFAARALVSFDSHHLPSSYTEVTEVYVVEGPVGWPRFTEGKEVFAVAWTRAHHSSQEAPTNTDDEETIELILGFYDQEFKSFSLP